jgi:hypothetical protein
MVAKLISSLKVFFAHIAFDFIAFAVYIAFILSFIAYTVAFIVASVVSLKPVAADIVAAYNTLPASSDYIIFSL